MMLSDINSSNPPFSIILSDFNARSNNWWQRVLKQVKDHELIISQPLMVSSN